MNYRVVSRQEVENGDVHTREEFFAFSIEYIRAIRMEEITRRVMKSADPTVKQKVETKKRHLAGTDYVVTYLSGEPIMADTAALMEDQNDASVRFARLKFWMLERDDGEPECYEQDNDKTE